MRALVTGGAGLIGSHIADALLEAGWRVRIFDNLEPQTHLGGKPAWIDPRAQFVRGDVRNPAALTHALCDIDVVFHEAAYGGYMPEIAKYLHVNSYGTALLLETIRNERFPIKKVIVASSQAVYSEGAGRCAHHGLVFPLVRSITQLALGNWSVLCPTCSQPVTSEPTPEQAPTGGETVYALTKVDQERLVLMWGRQTGIPTVALRYSCTYGPRQSVFNPYTGAIAIFCTRLLNGEPPVIYEDGLQTRDFSYAADVAQANLLVATTDAVDGLAVNVGSGRGVAIADVARRIARALDIDVEPVVRGEFRPGEIRHLVSDARRIHAIGYRPAVELDAGIQRYLDWIESQGDVREYFSAAEARLRAHGIVQRACAELRAM